MADISFTSAAKNCHNISTVQYDFSFSVTISALTKHRSCPHLPCRPSLHELAPILPRNVQQLQQQQPLYQEVLCRCSPTKKTRCRHVDISFTSSAARNCHNITSAQYSTKHQPVPQYQEALCWCRSLQRKHVGLHQDTATT
jgi:hypothetical protein